MFTHQEGFLNGKCLSEDFGVFPKAFWKDCTKAVYVTLLVNRNAEYRNCYTSLRTSERTNLHAMARLGIDIMFGWDSTFTL
jgi:hypothetical protein